MRRIASILFVAVLATLVSSRAARADEPWRGAIDEVLLASGVDDPARRGAYVARFEALRDRLVPRIEAARGVERKGRAMHRFAHGEVLRVYDAAAYGLDVLLDQGRYNCVSASVFEALLGSSVGLDVGIVAGPRHVFLRLDTGRRPIDVESTTPRGWDVTRDVRRIAGFLIAYRLASPEDLAREGVAALYDQYRELEPPAPVDRVAAFVWHVRAEALAERGEGRHAASAFARAAELHPGLASRSLAMRAGFARAFSEAYEAGRFDEAFDVAELEWGALGPATSARERLQAAAVQRILGHVEAGESGAAQAILDSAVAIAPDLAQRLERATCPAIAAAAVREGEFSRAERAAERYAAVEPDRVEAAKLAFWVASRRRSDSPILDLGLLPGFSARVLAGRTVKLQ